MKKIILICCLCSIILTGCGDHIHNIYAICAVDHGTRYCYDDQGKIYYEDDNKEMQPATSIYLDAQPKLNFYPEVGDYSLTYVSPNCYSCTLKDLSHYVFACTKQLGASMYVSYIDNKDIIIDMHYGTNSMKLYYNVTGNLRGYCVGNTGPKHLPLVKEFTNV